MKLKGALIIISILVLFFGGLTFILPREVSLVKTVQIFSPAGNVYNQIDNIHNWSGWIINPDDKDSEIQQMDKNDAKLIRSGKILMSIERLFPKQDTSVFQIQSEKGSPIVLNFRMDSLNTNLTKLDLIVSTRLKWYPWDRVRSIFYDKVMGSNFQDIVDNIKKVCEENRKK